MHCILHMTELIMVQYLLTNIHIIAHYILVDFLFLLQILAICMFYCFVPLTVRTVYIFLPIENNIACYADIMLEIDSTSSMQWTMDISHIHCAGSDLQLSLAQLTAHQLRLPCLLSLLSTAASCP